MPPADAAKKEPEKPKPPIFLSARTVETTVVRYPLPAVPAKPAADGAAAKPAAGGGLKYELERARCEGRVEVDQAPSDPAKNPRGLLIRGGRLILDQPRSKSGLPSAGGHMTVYEDGATSPPTQARVLVEDVAIFGPVVVVDQPNNEVAVDGRGYLYMLGAEGLTAVERPGPGAADRPTDIQIDWATEMRFFGAKRSADFVGEVVARQFARPADPRAPRPAGPPAEEAQATLQCHRLDVTFDKPIYFNSLRPATPPADKPGSPGQSAKVKTAKCTPLPDDEFARRRPGAGPPNRVYYDEATTAGPGGKLVKAQWIEARQLDVDNEPKEQTIHAQGPGEVRILQLGSKDTADPAAAPPAAPAGTKPTDQELKLTVVWFVNRMIAKDTNKVLQTATFPDGAEVVQLPSENLHERVEKYGRSPRRMLLACTQVLEVASRRLPPSAGGAPAEAKAEQSMTAIGNAEFKTEEYLGYGSKITYDGQVVVFEGGPDGQAKLFKQQRSVEQGDRHIGKKMIYNPRTGAVTGSDILGGTITGGSGR